MQNFLLCGTPTFTSKVKDLSTSSTTGSMMWRLLYYYCLQYNCITISVIVLSQQEVSCVVSLDFWHDYITIKLLLCITNIHNIWFLSSTQHVPFMQSRHSGQTAIIRNILSTLNIISKIMGTFGNILHISCDSSTRTFMSLHKGHFYVSAFYLLGYLLLVLKIVQNLFCVTVMLFCNLTSIPVLTGFILADYNAQLCVIVMLM